MPEIARITIAPTAGRVRVSRAGRVIADSAAALTLRETGRPPVQYLPRGDADMAALEPSRHVTHCPWKGDASYFSVAGDPAGRDAVWSYEAPLPAAAGIAGHLAFYADRFEIEILPG
mgnify:CR=1 FL=1